MPATDQPQQLATIRGRLLSPARFHRDGFFIGGLLAAVDGNGTTERVAVKGDLLEPAYGETYELHGEWETSPKYGRQFAFRSFRIQLPTSQDGIRRFLLRLKWVGPAVARDLTKAFGDDALDVIREHPERVATIRGITDARAVELQESLLAQSDLADARCQIETILAGLPISRRAVDSIIDRWGAEAPVALRRDPYQITEIHGIGFRTADSIAIQRLDYPVDGIDRRVAGVTHILNEEASSRGSTVMPAASLIESTAAILGGVEPGADALGRAAWEIEPGLWQIEELALAESGISARLRRLMRAAKFPTFPVREDGLADDQVAAVRTVESSAVAILTGPPGTGKTYALARIVEAALAHGVRPALAAPTGKAAKRMTEALTEAGVREIEPARTIHSLLGASFDERTGTSSFSCDRDNPIPAQFLIVDEVSMLDTSLLASLLDAVGEGSRVLLVGDPHQLPSVGPGAVLRDLLAGGIPHAGLTTIKRNTGAIVQAAHALLAGREPAWPERLDEEAGDNLRFVELAAAREIIDAMVAVLSRQAERRGLDPIWDCQVISPLNSSGPLSCDALNEQLQAALNPGTPVKGWDYRPGDKVVRTKNGQDENGVRVVNGDFGKVLRIEGGRVWVQHWFPDRECEYKMKTAKLKLAYAVTVHRMQGSSAPLVMLPVHRSFAGPIWTRELVYTAISRPERLCFLFGDRGVFRQAIRRQATARRRTRLAEMLREVER